MDFIEQWFGVSPDGGSGATELLYIIVLALILVLLLARRRIAPLSRAFFRRAK